MPEEHIVTQLSRSRPKAKKDYRCWACGSRIHKGNRHNKVVIKDEEGDAFLSVRMHFRCDLLKAEMA